jgi:hypothetical protein
MSIKPGPITQQGGISWLTLMNDRRERPIPSIADRNTAARISSRKGRLAKSMNLQCSDLGASKKPQTPKINLWLSYIYYRWERGKIYISTLLQTHPSDAGAGVDYNTDSNCHHFVWSHDR